MNLTQVKNEIGISSLQLNTAKDAEGNSISWMRHWDNDRRIAVSIHKDLVAEIKEKKDNITSLNIQTKEMEGSQGPYKAIRIVKYADAEEVL